MVDAVDFDNVLKVKVRTRRIARAADLRDNLPRADDLSRRDVQGTAVSVARVRVNGGMVNQHLVAVAVAEIVRDDDLPVEQRTDIRAVFVAQVDARMEFPFARNGMNPPAERTCHGEVDGLNLRGQVKRGEQNYQCPKLFQTPQPPPAQIRRAWTSSGREAKTIRRDIFGCALQVASQAVESFA